MSKYWFKPKKYGYGLHPVTWQGWCATILLAILCVGSGYCSGALLPHAEPSEWFRFILDIIVLSTLFVLLFKDKAENREQQ